MINSLKNMDGASRAGTIIALVLLTIFMVFILQNTNVVEIHFLFWELSLSRVLLLAGSLFIGILIGLIVGWEISSGKKKS